MAGGIVEWWIQVLGAVVTQAATRRNGFAVCACAQAVAALLLAGRCFADGLLGSSVF